MQVKVYGRVTQIWVEEGWTEMKREKTWRGEQRDDQWKKGSKSIHTGEIEGE